ncbi:MAG: hypothetical protein IJ814_07505 [Paludibacteraceae bacterium]|nr:hypothetical protein [Paludibacteraceae bacterium]MBR1878827.1 hypothetical protein [Paludibacteraceae bacterium]
MKRIFLSLAALCCIVASSFAAVGDKIYFVNSLDWENLYVTEYQDGTPWAQLSNTALTTPEALKCDNHDVYAYEIQNANCAFIALNNSTIWTSNSGGLAPVAGKYYIVENSENYYWLTAVETYYNEFFFLNNNDQVQNVTPNIMLYNVAGEAWTNVIAWPGAAMELVGTLKGVDTYKYVAYTTQEVTHVQFVNGGNADNDKTESVAVGAGKKFYGWNGLKAMNDVAPLHLVGDAAITGYNWDATALQMFWDETAGKFTYTVNNIFVVAGDYAYRVILGDEGDEVWKFKFPHFGHADWNESLHIAADGMYAITYNYDPVADNLTATATKVYTRNMTSGNYGTICLPNASGSWEGATFYTIAGKEDNSIVLEEVSINWLQAGRPYIFQAAETWLTVWFNDETAAGTPWVDHTSAGTNGLVGSFTEQALADNAANLYVLSNNAFHPVGENVKVGAYRAYLDMSAVDAAPAQAPGKRYVRVAVQGKMPTALENVQEAAQSTKVMENGVLYIIKNGVRYNAQGQIVK